MSSAITHVLNRRCPRFGLAEATQTYREVHEIVDVLKFSPTRGR